MRSIFAVAVIIALSLLISATPPKCQSDLAPFLAQVTTPLFEASLSDNAIREAIEADMGRLARAAKSKDNAAIEKNLAGRPGVYAWITEQAKKHDIPPYLYVSRHIDCYNRLDLKAVLTCKSYGCGKGVILRWRDAQAAATFPRLVTYRGKTYEVRDPAPSTTEIERYYATFIQRVREQRQEYR